MLYFSFNKPIHVGETQTVKTMNGEVKQIRWKDEDTVTVLPNENHRIIDITNDDEFNFLFFCCADKDATEEDIGAAPLALGARNRHEFANLGFAFM